MLSAAKHPFLSLCTEPHHRTVSDTVVELLKLPLCPLIVNLDVPAGVDFVVVTVIFVVPEVVTDVGEKLAFVPDGSPLTLNVTTPVKPFCAVTVTEYDALFPGLTFFELGEAAMVNEAAGGG